MAEARFSKDQIEAGRKLFAGDAVFVKGVVALDALPKQDRIEIAFAGRSNVGKSSLLNALTGRKALARASNTPGRTQEMNFFSLGKDRLYIVDLPGYGFADAPKKSVDAWRALTLDYLRNRSRLKRVFVLIDARRGLGEVDDGVLAELDAWAVAYQIVLTKIDKLKQSEVAPLIADTAAALKKHPAAHPQVIATSSETAEGIAELRAEICALG